GEGSVLVWGGSGTSGAGGGTGGRGGGGRGVTCWTWSKIESGGAASPTTPISSSRMIRSGRRGGAGGILRARSAMVHLRGQIGLDPVGEQQRVDALVQRLEGRRADVGERQVIGI